MLIWILLTGYASTISSAYFGSFECSTSDPTRHWRTYILRQHTNTVIQWPFSFSTHTDKTVQYRMEFFHQTLLFRYKFRFIFFARHCYYLGTNVNLFFHRFFFDTTAKMERFATQSSQANMPLKLFIKSSPIDFPRKAIIFTYTAACAVGIYGIFWSINVVAFSEEKSIPMFCKSTHFNYRKTRIGGNQDKTGNRIERVNRLVRARVVVRNKSEKIKIRKAWSNVKRRFRRKRISSIAPSSHDNRFGSVRFRSSTSELMYFFSALLRARRPFITKPRR